MQWSSGGSRGTLAVLSVAMNWLASSKLSCVPVSSQA